MNNNLHMDRSFGMLKYFSYLVSFVLLILILAQLNRQGETKMELREVEISEIQPLDIVFGRYDANLPVYVYASYNCSYCRMFLEDVMPVILEKYPDRVKVILRLTRRTNDLRVKRALSALVCVHKYGKYNPLHELLLNNHKVIYTEEFQTMITEFAERDAFVGECMDAGAAATYLTANVKEFERLKLPGTPSFVVEGRVYAGFQSVEQFERIIENGLVNL
ncbi:MAG: thioredoxin domain-containing protein [Salinivirgaceae bacterium]